MSPELAMQPVRLVLGLGIGIIGFIFALAAARFLLQFLRARYRP